MAEFKETIGFIGSGNMGESMISAVIKAGLFSPNQIIAGDIDADRLNYMAETYGVNTETRGIELFNRSDIIVLAVKPQKLDDALEPLISGIQRSVSSRKLIISIMAGIRIDKLQTLFYTGKGEEDQKKMPIVRVMPNTPALVLKGMSGMSANVHCSGDDVTKAGKILGAMGKVLEFDEEQLDAVTAISGSGPAYFFYFIDAMVQAGAQLGLDGAVAAQLAIETAAGAAKLISESGEAPAALIRKVASPGGTTQAALTVFETRQVKDNIMEGILAAAKRSVELSRT